MKVEVVALAKARTHGAKDRKPRIKKGDLVWHAGDWKSKAWVDNVDKETVHLKHGEDWYSPRSKMSTADLEFHRPSEKGYNIFKKRQSDLIKEYTCPKCKRQLRGGTALIEHNCPGCGHMWKDNDDLEKGGVVRGHFRREKSGGTSFIKEHARKLAALTHQIIPHLKSGYGSAEDIHQEWIKQYNTLKKVAETGDVKHLRKIADVNTDTIDNIAGVDDEDLDPSWADEYDDPKEYERTSKHLKIAHKLGNRLDSHPSWRHLTNAYREHMKGSAKTPEDKFKVLGHKHGYQWAASGVGLSHTKLGMEKGDPKGSWHSTMSRDDEKGRRLSGGSHHIIIRSDKKYKYEYNPYVPYKGDKRDLVFGRPINKKTFSSHEELADHLEKLHSGETAKILRLKKSIGKTLRILSFDQAYLAKSSPEHQSFFHSTLAQHGFNHDEGSRVSTGKTGYHNPKSGTMVHVNESSYKWSHSVHKPGAPIHGTQIAHGQGGTSLKQHLTHFGGHPKSSMPRQPKPQPALAKSAPGEGSKGGHVIGHTKSGKAIYSASKGVWAHEHASYTPKDHLDAADHHDAVAKRLHGSGPHGSHKFEELTPMSKQQVMAHQQTSHSHLLMGVDKIGTIRKNQRYKMSPDQLRTIIKNHVEHHGEGPVKKSLSKIPLVVLLEKSRTKGSKDKTKRHKKMLGLSATELHGKHWHRLGRGTKTGPNKPATYINYELTNPDASHVHEVIVGIRRGSDKKAPVSKYKYLVQKLHYGHAARKFKKTGSAGKAFAILKQNALSTEKMED